MDNESSCSFDVHGMGERGRSFCGRGATIISNYPGFTGLSGLASSIHPVPWNGKGTKKYGLESGLKGLPDCNQPQNIPLFTAGTTFIRQRGDNYLDWFWRVHFAPV